MVPSDKWVWFQHESYLRPSFREIQTMKMPQRHSFIDLNNFFAESNNSFQILEDYVLSFLGAIHSVTGIGLRQS